MAQEELAKPTLEQLQRAAEVALEQEKHEIVGVSLWLNATADWRLAELSSHRCRMEIASVLPKINSKKACRVSTKVAASLETFMAFIRNSNNQHLYDPSLKKSEIISMTPSTVTKHTVYTSTRLISPRDFVTKQAVCELNDEEIEGVLSCSLREWIGAPDGVQVRGYALGAINSDELPLQPSLIRGSVYCFAYVALSWSQKEVVVINVNCSDPRGSIPAFMVEGSYDTHCVRLDTIRKHCEAFAQLQSERALYDINELSHYVPPKPQVTATAKRSVNESEQDTSKASEITLINDSLTSAPRRTNSSVGGDTLLRRESTLDRLQLHAQSFQLSPLQVAVLRPFLTLHRRSDWRLGRVMQGCLLEECTVPYSKVKAIRISTDVACSLATFEDLLKDDSAMWRIDPALDKIELLQDHEGVSTKYTRYKQTLNVGE